MNQTEAIASAKKSPSPPKGMVKVVWKNELIKDTKKLSYGFNYQPTSKAFKAGDQLTDAYGGISDPSNVGFRCTAIKIITA